MTTRRVIALLSLLVLIAGACSSSGQADALEGKEYWSTNVQQNGEPFALADGTRITVSFAGGEIRAHAGCNSIAGAFEVQDDELRTTDLSMTAMGCDPNRQAQDAFLISVLSDAPSVTLDGDTLRLATASASIDFIDAAIANPDRPFEGTMWEIDGFLSGETASSFATDVRATIRIENGIMQLFDGCASTDLPVEVADGEIRFSPVGMPAADDCDAPPGYRQSIYTALSRGALAFTVNGTRLTLATPDNVGFSLIAVE